MAIPSGDIYLLNNVPLTVDYDNTIDFKDVMQQYTYFVSLRKDILRDYSYIRKEREYIVAGLPISYLDDVNYITFQSAQGERTYYAFVTNKVYVNENTTYIYFQIDVLQTYMFDYEWRASYIEQSHVDRWTSDQKPIYSKTDEGLYYGEEYNVETAFALRQSANVRWLMVSATDFAAIIGEGTSNEHSHFSPVASPYAVLLVPVVIGEAANNVTVYVNDQLITNYAGLMLDMISNTAFGNYIKTINLLTYNPFVTNEERSGYKINITLQGLEYGFTKLKDGRANGSYLFIRKQIDDVFNLLSGTLAKTEWNTGIDNSLPTAEQWEEIKANPYTTKRDKRFESKLLCYPYRYNLLTDWRNSPVIFKNEYLPKDGIEVKYSTALSNNAPWRFWIKDYKKDPEGRYTSLQQPIALEFPIISPAYETYMLENKNTIQANVQNSIISGVAGTITAAAGGVSHGGGVAGGIVGGVGGLISGALSLQAQIRSENAKQADLRNRPDNIINSVDSAFNIVDGNTEVTFYRMKISCVNEEILGEVFNMSGYKVQRVEIPNTRSRARFNYIKTVGANLIGSINQADLAAIKAIYDRGITIWHYNETNFAPLDYSLENIEVNLL